MARISLIVTGSPDTQVLFNIDEKVARQFETSENMIEKCTKKDEDTRTVPVKIPAPVLENIPHWAEYRKNDPGSSVVQKILQDICRWNIEFFEENHSILIELIKAADTLKFEQLHCDACVFISDVMRRKTPKDA